MGNDDESVTPPPREHDPDVFKKVIEGDRSDPQPMRETRAVNSDEYERAAELRDRATELEERLAAAQEAWQAEREDDEKEEQDADHVLSGLFRFAMKRVVPPLAFDRPNSVAKSKPAW